MTKLSGKVAILHDGQVVEVRDLGPTPIQVRSGVVRPLTETKPQLEEGERLTSPVYTVEPNEVEAVWGKEIIPPTPPSVQDRLKALEDEVFGSEAKAL